MSSTTTLERPSPRPMVEQITDELVERGLLPDSHREVFMPELDIQIRRQTKDFAARMARLGVHLGPERQA